MVSVSLDTAFDAAQVATLLRASDTSLLFADAGHLPVAQRAIADSPIRLILLEPADSLVAGPDFDALLQSGSDGFTPLNLRGDDTAAILYTSGTTCAKLQAPQILKFRGHTRRAALVRGPHRCMPGMLDSLEVKGLPQPHGGEG